jgi:hypothetical protein
MPDSPDVPEVVAALQAANGQLRAENSELKAENAELRERLARLERLISRNSGNSSMPPSDREVALACLAIWMYGLLVALVAVQALTSGAAATMAALRLAEVSLALSCLQTVNKGRSLPPNRA